MVEVLVTTSTDQTFNDTRKRALRVLRLLP
jgi:hypothetical protein